MSAFFDSTIQPVVSLQEQHSSVWMLQTWSTLGSLATAIKQRKACFMKTLRAHHHPVSCVQGCSGKDQDTCGTVKLQVHVCDKARPRLLGCWRSQAALNFLGGVLLSVQLQRSAGQDVHTPRMHLLCRHHCRRRSVAQFSQLCPPRCAETHSTGAHSAAIRRAIPRHSSLSKWRRWYTMTASSNGHSRGIVDISLPQIGKEFDNVANWTS